MAEMHPANPAHPLHRLHMALQYAGSDCRSLDEQRRQIVQTLTTSPICGIPEIADIAELIEELCKEYAAELDRKFADADKEYHYALGTPEALAYIAQEYSEAVA
jgi:hypothetical protein